MKKPRRMARGFTLIEVLIALLVFMVAMLGLVALQRASISGANIGREQTAAVNLARYVMTWLESEAATWPIADPGATPSEVGFPLLSRGISTADTWQTLSSTDVRFDAHLEHSGTPLYTASVDTAQYCVHYRVKPLGNPDDQVAYQVWVRVTWPKWGQYGGTTWKNCASRALAGPAVVGTYQVVELTGVVTREYTGRWS
jgi:prepilin-type N-terminal cleavage/methylation domain-containing protein